MRKKLNKRTEISKVHYPVIAFFLFALFTSCEYEPSGKNFVEIKEPSGADPLEVDLNLMTDTVYFYWEGSVILKIKNTDRKILSVEYYLDNNKVTGTYDGTLFSLLLNFSNPGVHKFKMVISTSTGTNSLADIIGSESYVYESREWTLIAKSYNLNTNITYELSKNGVTFTWKEYDGIDKKFYRLKDASTGRTFDTESTSFLNTAYVGEQSSYSLYVIDHDNRQHLWGTCTLNKSLPVLKIGNISNKVALIWNKSLFFENIAGYQVFQSDITSGYTKIATLSPSDTSLILNLTDYRFAQTMHYYIYCVPKGIAYIENTAFFSTYLQYVKLTLPGPYFEYGFGITGSGFYFHNYLPELNKEILYRYSAADDRVTTIMDYPYACDISPNANYLIIPGDSIIKLFDLNTMSVVSSVNMDKIASFDPSRYPKVSDNGICVFISGNMLYAYDLINKQLIGSAFSYAGTTMISPNAKYVTVDRSDSLKIYRINISGLSYQAGYRKSVFYPLERGSFLPYDDERLFNFSAPIMYIRSSLDLSVERSMDIGDWFYNVDFSTKKIFTAQNASAWNIFDFNTGNLLSTVKSELGSGGSNYTLLTNNTIYYSGYKYFLNN